MTFERKRITYGGANQIKIEDVTAIACQRARMAFTEDPAFWKRVHTSTDFLDRLLAEEGHIYGVTTGYGDSVSRAVPADLVDELPLHLSRFHGCGLGRNLSPEQGRAVLAVRLASLCRGYSGVSEELLRLLGAMIERDIVPVIPEEGSVGASGDLTPLSYIAAALVGEREAFHRGIRKPVSEILQEEALTPIKLRPKEALAVMNGTSVMTALSCIAFERAEYLSRLATRITAMAAIGLLGNPDHFDALLFQAKPHPGQARVAERVASDLRALGDHYQPARLQDRYSIRCAPHVIGVLEDMLPTFRTTLETEINSANDNPLIDPDGERILHGGHFYGGHVAFVADGMKNLVANIADLLDRQLAMLVDTKFNNGLPSNLSGSDPARASINHGLKAVQIGASAWTAEALKNTMPASVFSRSTECHNQDKVSMGTIASRDCLRVLELTEQVTAALLMAVCQAIRLRLRQGEIILSQLPEELQAFQAELEEVVPFLDEDRPLENVLRDLVARIQAKHWTLY